MALLLSLIALVASSDATSPPALPDKIPVVVSATTKDAQTVAIRAALVEEFEREGIFKAVNPGEDVAVHAEIDEPVHVGPEAGKERVYFSVILVGPGGSIRHQASCLRDELWECDTPVVREALDIASPPPQKLSDVIYVERRAWFAVCIGSCGEYKLTVKANGSIEALQFFGDPREGTIQRYSVDPEHVRRFQALLARYKPTKPPPLNLVCSHSNVPANERTLIIPNVTPLRIRWDDSDSAELVACDELGQGPLNTSLRYALREIRLWPTGHVICHLPSGDETICTEPRVVDAPQMVQLAH